MYTYYLPIEMQQLFCIFSTRCYIQPYQLLLITIKLRK